MKIETKIFGHRGYPAKFAENSLEGFEYALENGVDGIEFDVHLTRDQVPVVMHDEKSTAPPTARETSRITRMRSCSSFIWKTAKRFRT